MHVFLRKPRRWRNLLWLGAALFAAYAAVGCGKDSPAPAGPKTVGAGGPKGEGSESEPAATPEDRLYEQVRSGMFQMNAASGSIEEALTAAQEWQAKLPKADREVMADVIDLIDSAGSGIAEYADDPPAKEAIDKGFAPWDEKRLKAIDAGNDAMHDLREGIGTLDGLDDSKSKASNQAAREVRALILVALDDLYGAVEGFGGKPETEDGALAP